MNGQDFYVLRRFCLASSVSGDVLPTPDRFHLADYLLRSRLREGQGERTALICPDRNWTYAEVASHSNRWGNCLTQLGVVPEQRILIALPDGADFVGALFGTLSIGAVVVMVNPQLRAEEIAYFYDYTRARVALVHPETSAAFESALPLAKHKPRLVRVPAADSASDRLELFETHRDDAAIWLFSGGTTGRPKAVVQTHASFANTTELYARRWVGYRGSDITLSVPKLFFGYATGSNLFFPFSVGAAAILFPERVTPEILFEKIRTHRPTILINVPTMAAQMAAHKDAPTQDLSCLRFSTSAGEALPVELYERWKRTFEVELLDGLGTAEMWHIFISNRLGEVRKGTLGKAVEGFDVKVCDDEGRELPPGQVGALWVRGNSRALGYWQNADRTAASFRGEWVVTGDLLSRDADGFFTYGGRADDMLKVSGKWVAPGEVENCLLTHPKVRECAVVGVKDPAGLVKPCAYIVADGAPEGLGDELKDFVKSRLDPYKYPREIVFVDSLPRTHLGKVDRGRLRSGP